MLSRKLKTFFTDTSGAVTVDWIVLTAAVVGLVVVTITSIQSSSEALADNTGDFINAQPFF